MNKHYKFYMHIGDWSDDGHGKCEKYLILSNRPVENVREAHYDIKSQTGVDIENICSDYGQSELGQDIAGKIRELGFEFESDTDPSMQDENYVYVNIDEMARLWCFLLQKARPGLELEIISDTIPMLHFAGFDEKGRHIGQIGYGLL